MKTNGPQSVLERLERSPLALALRVLRDFVEHRGPVRAAALSYTSLLALVPLVALVISISKGMLKSQDPDVLPRLIDRFLAYAIPQLQYLPSDEAASARQDVLVRIQEAIGNIDAGALGVFGAITLVTVGVSLISAIEAAFNDVWGVHRGRPLARRVVYYWTALTLGPILPLLSLGLLGSGAAAVSLGQLPVAPLVRTFWLVLPFLVLVAGFTLLYGTLPNTSVPLRAAAAGGLVAGILLQLNNLGSALYFSQVVGYSKVYGSLGAVPVVMIGLYFSWMIVLIGAEVAHAVGSPVVRAVEMPESADDRARIVLAVARETAAAFLEGRGGATRAEIALARRYPPDWVDFALERLRRREIVVAASRDGAEHPEGVRFLPARPPDAVTALEVLAAARAGPDDAPAVPPEPAVDEVLGSSRRAEAEALGGVTLGALARDRGDAGADAA